MSAINYLHPQKPASQTILFVSVVPAVHDETQFRMQVFGFIRKEFGRTASSSAASKGNGDGVPPAGGGSEAGSEGADLSQKREIVLDELPCLMELNKVSA